ncbi:bifunctional diguanylate cyclase/phosphodiesterase [Blastococcus sp. TF02A-35]|uniref:putative bifunctional diguanylate cyclase/phosphodiesterase n=1 Tax=Blastococcus sp. TF02A-35 TaxID=2559612 RepID=UPI0010737AE7|nr:bifunctional diguanylate cyclase/phosphodiesterase [Blastococcus sp. TF02A_35]TFV44199.1 bifunctional diguanylate cyclase/phosphodiesterase [Blastococcus sp. TF02A_35]
MDQNRSTERHRAPSSGLLLALTLLGVALFATGVGPRPAGLAWDRLYDVLLYNTAYLPAALACWYAAGRLPRERLAWRVLAVSLLLNAVANGLRSWTAGPDGGGTSPLVVVDVLSLLAYLMLYVVMVGLIRARVPRFHPSMWLDGLVGALGTMSVGLAFLIGPYLDPAPGREAVPLVQLVLPATDVLLFALLGAVGSILGVRLDRTLVLVIGALASILVGDVLLTARTVRGTYVDGGPLELAWLVGIVLVALAAHHARPRPAPDPSVSGTRLGGRLLALPLVCVMGSLVVLANGWGDDLPEAAAWVAIGCVLAAVTRTGVTFREVRAFNEVREQARTDELTGLANRRALLDAADRVLRTATARKQAALLLLDLDGFKEVNDSLGHTAGDQLLRQIGPRLLPALGPHDVLARLGGDEFAVLLPEVSLDEAQERAERLRALVLQPFPVEDIRLHVGVSIGVATAPVPAATVQEMLRCADVAMYAAKAAREGVHVYVPDPHGGSGDRLRTMEELRTALEGDELLVHLQPQVGFADGRVVGVEALVRWQHPVRGLLSPAELLPAAEQAGLLRQLTDKVLDLALGATTLWWSADPVPVSVNLSAANVNDVDLPEKVAAALAHHGLPADALTLELVEDTLMADPERGRQVLAELRRLGVRTSIDDYGTGYSSLAYLRHLPADELKLDRSLTADVTTDPRAAAIVRHTASLAHDLGLRLVVEGVEDAAACAALARLGCDIAQGYAISRPMPVGQFLAWLEHPQHPLLDPGRSLRS